MSDAELMQRAIDLAMRGRGRVEPNPMVGCVLARNGQIIGEGYHHFFGGPHAEPDALASCPDPAGATAYITLEPCCHAKKKTPPCVPQLIAAKIARVVAACQDPNPQVSGRGFQQLRDAGIKVDEGVLAAEAKQLNTAFFKQAMYQRPYVTLKWAQTADGKIAGAGGRTLRISNATSFRVMHELRARCDAIMVGIGTVIADDPLLTTRGPDPSRTLLRIVLDSQLRIPMESQLVKTARQAPLLVCCNEVSHQDKALAVDELKRHGVEVLSLRPDPDGRHSLDELLNKLGQCGITHLLVEPGTTLAKSFLRQGLADRIWIVRSPLRVDADNAPAAVHVDYPVTGTIMLNGDELTEYLNPKSPVFFSLQPSADFALAQGSASTNL